MSEFLSQFGPQIMSMLPSFFLGFFAGRFAKKALKKTLIIGGAGLAVLVGLGVVSMDAETARNFAQSGSSWLSENLEGVSAYLAALLPSATAAAAGGAIGFRGARSKDGAVKGKAGEAAKEGVKGSIRRR